MRSGDPGTIRFQIHSFLDKDKVLLEGKNFSVYTIARQKELVKIQSRDAKRIPWEIINCR